jgi:hypothetical protein
MSNLSGQFQSQIDKIRNENMGYGCEIGGDGAGQRGFGVEAGMEAHMSVVLYFSKYPFGWWFWGD